MWPVPTWDPETSVKSTRISQVQRWIYRSTKVANVLILSHWYGAKYGTWWVFQVSLLVDFVQTIWLLNYCNHSTRFKVQPEENLHCVFSNNRIILHSRSLQKLQAGVILATQQFSDLHPGRKKSSVLVAFLKQNPSRHVDPEFASPNRFVYPTHVDSLQSPPSKCHCEPCALCGHAAVLHLSHYHFLHPQRWTLWWIRDPKKNLRLLTSWHL